MTTISWAQIDTNNSGYIDGNEVEVAKKNGAINIWNNMSKADFESNITKEEKLKGLTEKYAPELETTYQEQVYIENIVTIGNVDRKEYTQKLKNEAADAVLHLNRELETLKEEYHNAFKDLFQKFNMFEALWYLIKDPFTTAAKHTEKHVEFNDHVAKIKQLAQEIGITTDSINFAAVSYAELSSKTE